MDDVRAGSAGGRRGLLALAALMLALAACSGGATRPAPAAPAPAPAARETPRRPIGIRPKYVGTLEASITEADLDSLWTRQLMVPVEGIARRAVVDNYNAVRSGRAHAALDMAAPKLTPVLAADDCVIGRLLTGPVGGIVIYATDPSGRFVYYYAHLERYRRGLAVGDRVAKGSIIGYVGSTGNASPKAPHLHFQVMKRGTRAWWDGPPINPRSFFVYDGGSFGEKAATR